MMALTGFKSGGKNEVKLRSNGFKGTLSFIHSIIHSESTEENRSICVFTVLRLHSPAVL